MVLTGGNVERLRAFALAATGLICGCSAGLSIDEAAREVLWVRLIGFIVVIAIVFFFVFRNLRRK
jgi:thiosulfate reductase cytochrome b subunit